MYIAHSLLPVAELGVIQMVVILLGHLVVYHTAVMFRLQAILAKIGLVGGRLAVHLLRVLVCVRGH